MEQIENFETNLQYMVHTCAVQARWHHEQYLRLQYCERYFAYLLQYREHYDENYIENLVRNLNMRETRDNMNDTDSQVEFVNTENSDDNLVDTQSPARKKKKKRKKKTKVKPREDILDVKIERESGLELDDGFKKFLKESAKFRAERDAQKNQVTSSKTTNDDEEETIEVEYVDILRKGPDGTTLPPTAQNRKKLYEEKYGQCGTTILSLETALQWKFNKFTDCSSPTLWPALPLRLIYDQ